MGFRFKQFSIDDSHCAMKIGTDAVLLGAWTNIGNASRILDVGTGSGVIALMLAQRSGNSLIDAIDIDEDSVRQAGRNIHNSKWKNRIRVSNISLQEFSKTEKEKYDLIVSNPPYYHNMLKSADEKKKKARHTDELTHEELYSYSKKLLNEDGKICVVFPYDILSSVKETVLKQGFYVTRLCQVFPKEGSDAKRVLLQFEMKRKELFSENITILQKDGVSYTPEYKILTKDFYLMF